MNDGATPDDPDDPDTDDAAAYVLGMAEHLTDCLGMSPGEAAHCLMGCAFFIAGEDQPAADFAEWLAQVREVLDEREADLRARAS
jgi:hypothetical protein